MYVCMSTYTVCIYIYIYIYIFIFLHFISWIKPTTVCCENCIQQFHLFSLLPSCETVLTHSWALPTAPGSTLSSEHGHLSLQHLHPGDELLDGCCCHWLTTARSFWDVDAVSECYLKDNKGFPEKCKLAPIELVIEGVGRLKKKYSWRTMAMRLYRSKDYPWYL